ncbi:PH domain-containing protein [Salinibacter altiplanensis]|uniref:PH domain-containing protein n=1 Tax=Salinibacter altiplanensis TaxID=1803181 RepID=UPI000C9F4EF8|nr:PH domain-containing protein [Salinibacter altiplanensis]
MPSPPTEPNSDGRPDTPPAPDRPPDDEAEPAPSETAEDAAATTLGAIREPQRLHPLTLLLRVGTSLPALVIILFPLLRNPGSTENVTSLVFGALYGAFALPAILLQYWRFSYRITPKQIVIQSGVLNRKNRSIPIERVQNIQIERNLVARLCGIAKVKLETAGSSSTEGSLAYVHQGEARKIRQVVRSFQRGAQEADAATSEDAADTETLLDMPLRRVLLSGAFRFSLLYLAVIFTVLELFNPEALVERVLRARGRVGWVSEIVFSHPALAILATVVAAVFLGWVSGIGVHVARYYNFRLWLDGDKLRKRHGLFTVTEGTVPLDKVQALILRTNPFMRAFGWYELKVQTVGLDVEEQGHRVIAPFAGAERILELARRVRSVELPESFAHVSRLTIRRRFIRYTAVWSALLLPTVYFWPADWLHLGGVALPWWGFGLVPFILGWAVLQYRNHTYAAGEDGFYIRRGVLSHYLWILPVEKFHVFHATASIFQRRLGLKTLFVDTAGAATFAYPEVIDAPAGEADAQFSALYRRFRQLYRGRMEAEAGVPGTRLAPSERPRLPVDEPPE